MRNSSIYGTREKRAENGVWAGGKFFETLEKREALSHDDENDKKFRKRRVGRQTTREKIFGYSDSEECAAPALNIVMGGIYYPLRHNSHNSRFGSG
jgi:hypothetical protein